MSAERSEFPPLFSRNGESNASGKLTRRLDIPVSEELEEAIIALAVIAGMPKSEFARRLLERCMYGELSMQRRVSRGSRTPQGDESGDAR